jgi:hypothetical protein
MYRLRPARCCEFCLNGERSTTIGQIVCPHNALKEARESHTVYMVCDGFSPNEQYQRITRKENIDA